MHYRLLSVGSDIEVFLKDKRGHPVPVCGLLGGTKESPKEVPLGPGFCVQEDNVMAEFNIPPAQCADDFALYLLKMKKFLADYFKSANLELDVSPSQVFHPQQLLSPQARKFGCEPDYNVWTLTENEIDTENPLLRRLRTAGGHIHVSFDVDERVPELAETFVVVKALDLYLGVPSVFADTDQRRRQFYGRPGAFRVKQYSKNTAGIEYRTLSNFWFDEEDWMYYVYGAVRNVFSYLNLVSSAETKLDEKQERIAAAINGNLEVANELLKEAGLNPMKSKKQLEVIRAAIKAQRKELRSKKSALGVPEWLVGLTSDPGGGITAGAAPGTIILENDLNPIDDED